MCVVIALDATLSGWGRKTASWVMGGERMPSGCFGHLVTTAVSLQCLLGAYKYWTLELSLLPPLDSLQLSLFHSWAMIFSLEKDYSSQGQK